MAADPGRPPVEFAAPAPEAAPEESTLGAYLRAVQSHRVLIAVVILAAIGGSVLWLSVRSPTYQSRAELLVTPLPPEQQAITGLPLLRDSGDATRTMQTAAALVDSREAATLTARRLDGWTPERVQNAVEVKPEGQANILDITATAESAPLAAEVANVFAQSTLDVRRDLVRDMASAAAVDLRARLRTLEPSDSPVAEALQVRLSELQALAAGEDPTLSLSQRAEPPTAPVGARWWQVVFLALLAGVVLGTGTALLISVLPINLISTEDEFLRIWPLPVLARIPRLPRARQLPPTIDPSAQAAFRTLRRQLELAGPRRRLVLITSPSHGDGKTTTAVAFASVLAESGSEVVLVEGDTHKPDLRRVLGLGPRPWPPVPGNLASSPLWEALSPVPGLESVGLLEFADGSLDGGAAELARSKELLRQASQSADYVVVDTPPLGEVSDALLLLPDADSVVIVWRLGSTRRSDVRTTRELLARSRVVPDGLILVGSRDAGRSYRYGG